MACSKREDLTYGLSSIPGVVIATVIAVYYSFYRLPTINAEGLGFDAVLWDIIPYVFVPSLVLTPLSFSIMCEMLLRKKERQSSKMQLKRLLGRIIIQIITVAMFLSVYVLFLTFLLPVASASVVLVGASLTWSFLVYVVARANRTKFKKLEKGDW